MPAPFCEDFGVPGGEVVIRRAGVVWRRVLCDWCFQTRRANTEAAGGGRIVVKPQG